MIFICVPLSTYAWGSSCSLQSRSLVGLTSLRSRCVFMPNLFCARAMYSTQGQLFWVHLNGSVNKFLILTQFASRT